MTKRILLPMLAVLAATLLFVAALGGGIWLFLDFYSLLLVPALGTAYAFLAAGWGEGRRAFAAPFEEAAGPEELGKASSFFDLLGRSYLGFAFLTCMMSTINLFRNLEDRTKLGPNLAVSFVGMEYAALLILLIVLPYQAAIRKRLAGPDGRRPRQP